MSNTLRRRPGELASSVSIDGPISETTPSEAQPIPGVLAAYPGCMPKPRNLPEYQAACRAAQGQPVTEVNACEIVPGTHVYHGGRFLAVINTDRIDPHADVELRLAGSGLYVVRVVATTAPIYRLASAPDACSAPGAEATADNPTAAAR